MFKELFYWMSRFIKRNESNKDPELNAYFLITMLEGINIATIWGLFNHFISLGIPQNAIAPIFILVGVVLLVVNYTFLCRKRKEIASKIEQLTIKRKKIGKSLFVAYNLVTILFMIYVAYNLIG
jgi:hypothetical protein